MLDSNGEIVIKYTYDAWGNYAAETLDYYNGKGFINADDISYIEPETIGGLNLYSYCGNNPVMGVDPNGTAWWHWVLGSLTIVGITALTVITAGVAAAAIGTALGVGSSLVGAAMTGAAIGGLVSGGVELVSQGIISNWQTVNFGALAIESFTGSLYGAASGMMGATSSVGVRLGMRAAIVASSGINTALHGINQGKSFKDIMLDVGMSIGVGLVLQGVLLGSDIHNGKLLKSVLESYTIDGFTFMLKDKLLISGISTIKNIWRNRNDWLGLL